MTLHVALTHRTRYRYDRPVQLGAQTIRLRPAPHSRTRVLSYALNIEPAGHFLNWQQDPQGNFLARAVFPRPVTHFEVTVDLLADMATINPFDFFLEPAVEQWPFAYDHVLDAELSPFLTRSPAGPLLDALLAEISRDTRRTVPMLVGLNAALRDRIEYVVRHEPGVRSVEDTLAQARGSCRDSAWLLVQVARHLGLAARFVSGYLIQLRPDENTQGDGARGADADFADLHAWAEIYLPGAGWVGFDVTSGLLTGEGHIALAASPEPASAAAISGLVGPCETEFTVSMEVARIVETPRPTAPYPQAVWRSMLAAGDAVDRRLQASEVGLSMGSRPVFAAAPGTSPAEWNNGAPGPGQRLLAERLIRKLMASWSPGAALQHAASEPGSDGSARHWREQAHWRLQAHWRPDGVAVWNDPSRLATEGDKDDASASDANAFARLVARLLPPCADRPQRSPLAVRPVDGLLHVFLPLLEVLEDWLALVWAVEQSSAALRRRIVLEGYPPPRDARIRSFSVTADRGVIATGAHPSADWREHVERNTQLYDAAREAGLAAGSFRHDGRQVATGDSTLLLMGGARAPDSPFLHRPDLLKSLLGFWHNHPSLFCLFQGQFISPDRRYPRIGETLENGAAELEIALARIHPPFDAPAGAPADPGLVGFRTLEMPPHPRMAAAEALLLRAAIALFWDRPYERRLVRWGTRLHDDFMLPHPVHEDLLDALDDLSGFGLRLDAAFFAAHHAIRFPPIGSTTVRDIELALHQALEPNGMANQAQGWSAAGDRTESLMERLQVRVRGWNGDRYVLACNGAAVPLAATSRDGEHVAGVRYPVRPTSKPLVFDVYDLWNARSLGGITYHVADPGSGNYQNRPVNAREAEARRQVRFQPFGHTAAPMVEPLVEPRGGLPRTLDLSRVAADAGGGASDG